MENTQSSASQIDSSIFKKKVNTLECVSDYKTCPSIHRLLTALQYYSMLNILNNQQHRTKFTRFVNEIYCQLIDDYIHLNNEHSQSLQQMNEELKECNISSCRFTSTHHRTTNNSNDISELEPMLNVYKQTMDGLHFYLFHCFHTGLRTKQCDNVTEEIVEQTGNEYFDAEFSRINKIILERKHLTKTFDRFSTKNTKFNIKTDNEDIDNNDDNDTTYLDELYLHLKEENIKPAKIKQLEAFVTSQEYDTDSIQCDFDIHHGNISNCLQNKQCIQIMHKIVKAIKISSSSFSIGLRFYYWEYYKSVKQIPGEQWSRNINNHSGYDICELFIKRKYASFKEEIANYKHMTFAQYNQAIVKVKLYENSQIVKVTTAVCDAFRPPHYDIAEEQPLHFRHLLSLVLYTDYTNLSGDFSSTFRKNRVFESIESIKKRNSVYYWFSKAVRECVECYGECRLGDDRWEDDMLSGPFYSGMSVLMNMPQFNMRLCSPTSTSIQIQVAMKFCGDKGMVIQFNNPPAAQYGRLRGFNVSWISRYKEEDERLFCGGYNFIKIESVRIKSTHQNFQTFVHCVYYLDTMITGGEQEDMLGNKIEINEKDIFIISTLFKYILNEPAINTFDPYIYSTFTAFCQNKQQIILDLFELNLSNNKLRDLMLYPLDSVDLYKREKENKREDDDFRNLFRSTIFEIFENVKSVIIQSTSDNGYYSYSLSMIALLSLIDRGSLEQIIIKAVTHRDGYGDANEYNWIHSLWLSSSAMLKKKYSERNYVISAQKMGEHRFAECWFKINKKT